jgi:hypothetical protein
MSSTDPARKRICVITNGNVRVVSPCTEILVRQLGLAANGIDVYAMFWDDADLELARSALPGARSLTLWTTPRVNFTDDLTMYPKPPETVIHNFLSMAWSRLQLRRKLLEEGVFERYDLFVLVRLDTCFGQVLDFAEMDRLLEQHDVLLPLNGHWNNGWNDQFCAARAPAMQTHLGLFDHVKAYLVQGVTLHPETLLRHHMERHGARRGLLNLVNYLWRSDTVFRVG